MTTGFEKALKQFLPDPPLPLDVNIVLGDARDKLKEVQPESVGLVVTDPPYFLDGLDNDWVKGKTKAKRDNGSSVGGLPVGMKFDPRQGKALQAFITEIATLCKPLLLPGAFAIVFSQSRLSHRVGVALEDVGFEIRDMYAWRYTKRAQFKAFSLDHFVDKQDLTQKEKTAIKRQLLGRKTPQLRPQFETMIVAQKPREGTMLDNWLNYKVGLIDPNVSLDGKVPSTVMTVEKPEKRTYNGHLTVKPVKLIRHLIELFTVRGQTVLDPFLGSGTTALAAIQAERSCIGIEIDPSYVELAERRIKELNDDRD